MKTYKGSCHCGRITFSVTMELDHVRVCDCSICYKRGALNHRVPKQNLDLHSAWDDLVLYQWGSNTAKDYFCPVCGILPFRHPSHPTVQEQKNGAPVFEGWAVNVRCLNDVDTSNIPINKIYGSKI